MEKTHENLTQLYLSYVNNYTEFMLRPTRVKKILLRRILKQIRNTTVVLREEIEEWHAINKIYDKRKTNTIKERYSKPKKIIDNDNT